ncbi:antibiotic biosynthesis monooxygenase [Lacticaseibacillus parakribbianus]|uniref:antibiotic biosynthesis monooxygenase n=1 Tax=Lacticaseibacillus parakribbianus TaxID=2970927 RepID=UPI0021CB804C|nr:antibiotic biosynthesis monooxygenase [Lacticaseibacillus parakribbianus]
MTNKVQMTLGTRYYLKRLLRQNPQHMLLLDGLVQGQSGALLDPSGTAHFAAPMRGTVLARQGALPETGYVHVAYFRLSKDDAPIFAAEARKLVEQSDRLSGLEGMWLLQTQSKILEFVLLSAWQRRLDVFAAKGTPLYAPLTPFIKLAGQGLGYHEAAYRISDPNATAPDFDEHEDKRPLTLADLFKKTPTA